MKKYDIVIVNLNPTSGSEQQGVRPCLVLQNNIANSSKLQTVTIAPFTSNIKLYPASIIVEPSAENKLKSPSRLELSQIRTIDKHRILMESGVLDEKYRHQVQEKLIDFFDVDDLW